MCKQCKLSDKLKKNLVENVKFRILWGVKNRKRFSADLCLYRGEASLS